MASEPREGKFLGQIPSDVEIDTSEPATTAKRPADGTGSKVIPDMSVDSKFSDEEKNSTDPENAYDMARYAELIKAILHLESEEKFLPERNLVDLTALPVKEYLDATVVPILIQALEYLATYRPPEPINALCVYLLKYRDEYEFNPNEEEAEDEAPPPEEPVPEEPPEPVVEEKKKKKKK